MFYIFIFFYITDQPTNMDTVAASRRRAMKTVKYCSVLLRHVCACEEKVCSIVHCKDMKASIEHSQMCLRTDCVACRGLKRATWLHARYCRAGHLCPVQGCEEEVMKEYVCSISIVALYLTLTSPYPHLLQAGTDGAGRGLFGGVFCVEWRRGDTKEIKMGVFVEPVTSERLSNCYFTPRICFQYI